MTPAHEPINRVFAPEDLSPLLEEAGVDGTVLVQTWSSKEETKEFLSVAGSTQFVKGVVGWVDLTAETVGKDLDSLLLSLDGVFLKGIRHQVHDESDPNWLQRPDVLDALLQLRNRDLVFDLLIRPREIPAALHAAGHASDMRFVVDHIAKPDIAADEFDDWSKKMRPFASMRDHVWCKLSGMVTEADWANWESADYTRYINRVLEIFGTDRVMVGSDWPVCTLATNYKSTLAVVRNAIADLSYDEQVKILRTNAIDAYKLTVCDG